MICHSLTHLTVAAQIKQDIAPEELCSSMPFEFAQYLHYVRQLAFEERPNYGRLINKFRNALMGMGIQVEDQDYDFDREHNPKRPVAAANS